MGRDLPEGYSCYKGMFLTFEPLLPGPNMTKIRDQKIKFKETDSGQPIRQQKEQAIAVTSLEHSRSESGELN